MDDSKERLLLRINYQNEYGEHLRLIGHGSKRKALCPFHKEKTPSLSINLGNGMYHCFGCHVGGDYFDFLMRSSGKTFIDVLRELCAKYGIEYRAEPPKHKELIDANNAFQAYCKSKLDEVTTEYLNKRGLKREYIDKFGIGFCDKYVVPLTKFCSKLNVSPETLIKYKIQGNGTGLYNFFGDRIVFPLYLPNGTIAGFGGRTTAGREPKYLNSTENELYRKQDFLYGLNWAQSSIRKANEVIIVEGYFDVCVLMAHGVDNVVAVCSSSLSQLQIDSLKRLCSRVALCLDGDAAGRAATLKMSLDLYKAGFGVSVIPLDCDPDEYVLRGHDLKAAKRETIIGIILNTDWTNEEKLQRVREYLPYLETTLKWESIRLIAAALKIPECEVEREESGAAEVLEVPTTETECEKLIRILLNHPIKIQIDKRMFPNDLYGLYVKSQDVNHELTDTEKLLYTKLLAIGYESESPEEDAKYCYERMKREYIVKYKAELLDKLKGDIGLEERKKVMARLSEVSKKYATS